MKEQGLFPSSLFAVRAPTSRQLPATDGEHPPETMGWRRMFGGESRLNNDRGCHWCGIFNGEVDGVVCKSDPALYETGIISCCLYVV